MKDQSGYDAPARAVLEATHCWEPRTDRVPGRPQVTAFKQRARLHQAQWREQRDYPIGSQPMAETEAARAPRPIGSRIKLDYAENNKVNILTAAARRATDHRLASAQRHQTLNTHRLWGDLLSSMPMCFNLFGPFADDLGLARSVLPI